MVRIERVGNGTHRGRDSNGRDPVVNDLSAQPVDDPWREHVERFTVNSSVSIPFETSHGRMVLVVYARHVDSFDEKTVSGLEQICRDVEYCVAHLRSVSELAAALEGTLEALSYMTETRDPYTAGHQSHVGTLGALIATKLGLGAKDALLIRQSGDLHDVGKVIVPAEILTRPGRLTDLGLNRRT